MVTVENHTVCCGTSHGMVRRNSLQIKRINSLQIKQFIVIVFFQFCYLQFGCILWNVIFYFQTACNSGSEQHGNVHNKRNSGHRNVTFLQIHI